MPKKKKLSPQAFRAELEHYLQFLKKQPEGFAYYDKPNKQQQLDTLFAPFKQCTRCPLGSLGRQNVVFGDGNPEAQLMFIGEGPGRNEDAQGKPFVGRAGVLLDKIIEAMGLQRQDVYISNVVKCRPPKNRAPTPQESGTCTSLMLWHQINIIAPKIICTLGASATQGLLGPDTKIGAVRGNFTELDGIKVMPTYHPAYLLRNPAEKVKVWADMQVVMRELGLEGAKK